MDINLLVCSDLHASQSAMEMIRRRADPDEYDLVVVCGDFTTFGTVDYTKKFLKEMKGLMVLAVPGNCDIPDTVRVLEKAHASVHDRAVDFGGWRFFGFGGSVPTSNGMPFEVPEEKIVASLRRNAAQGGVMVTHMPAYGMNDRGRSGKHTGSTGILNIVKEFKPKLVLSGHMHESRGMESLNGTIFVNPGSARNGFYASVWLGKDIKVRFHEDDSVEDKPQMF